MFIKTDNNKIINASSWKIDDSYTQIDFNFEKFVEKPQGYYVLDNGNIIENPNFEAEIQLIEREKLNKLSLSKREVFLAIYKDKGLTPDDIKKEILKHLTASPTDAGSYNSCLVGSLCEVQNDMQNEALIEFDYASEYFRGNPLIDSIGALLGYTSQDLDYLFLNKEFPEQK